MQIKTTEWWMSGSSSFLEMKRCDHLDQKRLKLEALMWSRIKKATTSFRILINSMPHIAEKVLKLTLDKQDDMIHLCTGSTTEK